MPALLHEKPVTADHDVRGRGDGLERTEQRDLDLHVGELGAGNRRKPRVAAACGDRAPRHDHSQRLVRLDVADAPAQIAAHVQPDECSARALLNYRLRIADRGFGIVDARPVRDDGFTGPAQQQRASGVTRHATENVPRAAARYPTTVDLSPETSPESA